LIVSLSDASSGKSYIIRTVLPRHSIGLPRASLNRSESRKPLIRRSIAYIFVKERGGCELAGLPGTTRRIRTH
jgi:hypothetical protein